MASTLRTFWTTPGFTAAISAVVAFYTRDQSVGFFTSFTYADLFGTQRYYYNDLSAHISPVYDENGTLTGYDGDEAWNDCWTVQPMLALEDSWVSYEIGTEHTAPNYSSLGTGNRFRLLFGQSYPLECRTNQSAKYTHTLFITLQGAPKITEEPPELDGTLGSHSATFQISVGQQALRDALAQYLDIASSDSSVLEITGITVTPDAQYSDLATVTVHYTVHAEGEVELSFGFGGTSIAENRQVTAKQPEEKPTEPTKPAETAPSTEPSEGPGGGPSAPTGGAEPRETTPSVPGRPWPVRGSTVRIGRADGGRGPGDHPHVRPARCAGFAAAGRRAGGSAGRGRSGACHRCYGAAGG